MGVCWIHTHGLSAVGIRKGGLPLETVRLFMRLFIRPLWVVRGPKYKLLAAHWRLLQERQHALGLLVGLCQHRSRRLLDDLRFGQLGRRGRIVRVHDGTA